MSRMFGPSYRKGGVNYPNCESIAEHLEDLQNYSLREEDFLLCSYPKSGTHWVNEIMSLILLGSARDYATTPVLNIEVLGPQAVEGFKSPKVIHSHLPYDALPEAMRRHKVVYVIRNPKDQMVSMYHHYSSLRSAKNLSWSEFFDSMLQDDEVEYGSWTRNVLQWWTACHDTATTLILFYEDVMQNHEPTVRKLCEFMGQKLDAEVIRSIVAKTTFDRMKSDKKPPQKFHTWFNDDFSIYRKGQIGDWRNYFTEQQNSTFDIKFNAKVQATHPLPPLFFG